MGGRSLREWVLALGILVALVVLALMATQAVGLLTPVVYK